MRSGRTFVGANYLSAGGRCVQRIPADSVRPGQSRHSRTRSVSRGRAGARFGIFRPAGCPHTAVFTQYLQRIGNRHRRLFHSRARLPDSVGGAGHIASEHGFDGACRTGAFARPFRLGTLYRYRHQAACDTPQAPCLHVVGWVCTTKREADRQSKSFDTDRASSVSSVGISRFFWLPPFFTGKQLFESTRYRTDKLEAMNAVFKRQSLRVRFIWRNSNSS